MQYTASGTKYLGSIRVAVTPARCGGVKYAKIREKHGSGT
jgi:hypothetical protein